jgi:hypothetical protein
LARHLICDIAKVLTDNQYSAKAISHITPKYKRSSLPQILLILIAYPREKSLNIFKNFERLEVPALRRDYLSVHSAGVDIRRAMLSST